MAGWSFIVPFIILFFTYAYLKLKSNEIRKKKGRSEKLSVAFLHPDLGIGMELKLKSQFLFIFVDFFFYLVHFQWKSNLPGGAEKLVVEAALGLQKRGHKVKIFTSYHDKNRCFPATSDGKYFFRFLIAFIYHIFLILLDF